MAKVQPRRASRSSELVAKSRLLETVSSIKETFDITNGTDLKSARAQTASKALFTHVSLSSA